MNQFLDFLFSKVRVNASECPILMTEVNNPRQEDREKLIEYVFESYGSPAYFACKKSILSLFANGKSTGLVFESGHSLTQAVAISDGFILNKATQTMPRAGETLTKAILEEVEKKQQIHPLFDTKIEVKEENEIRRKIVNYELLADVDPSVRSFHKLAIAREIKEALVRITTPSDEK